MTTTMTSKASFISTVNEMINKKDFTVMIDDAPLDYEEFVKDGFNYTIIKVAGRCNVPFYSIDRTVFPYKRCSDSIYDKGVYHESAMVFKNVKNDKLQHMGYNKNIKRQTSCKLCNMVLQNYNYSSYFRQGQHNKKEKHQTARSICANIILETTKLNIDVCNLIMSYL
jgi:hypothetical protein